MDRHASVGQMTFRDKIITPNKLKELIDTLRTRGKKIVMCHGDFDLLHRGHLHQFEQAKDQGDVLVVSITADVYMAKGPDRPVFNQGVRSEMISAIGFVDFVTICNGPHSAELIKLLAPDVYVKGASCEKLASDLSSGFSMEKEMTEMCGGRVFYSHEMPIHATPLLNSFIDPYPKHVLEYLGAMKAKYSFNDIATMVDHLRSLRVLIIGEAIIDQYDSVFPMDLSPKGEVVAMRHLGSELFAGGSLACANHIANFCSDVRLVTYAGTENSHEEMMRASLAPNVSPWFLMRKGFPTIVKRRQVSNTYFRKFSETYVMDDTPLNKAEEEQVLSYLEDHVDDFDLILVIDYGHGFITDRIVECLSRANRSGRLAVNTQTNSANKGFNLITKYPVLNYACLDHYEIKLAMGDKLSEPEEMAVRLMGRSNSTAVAVTLGHSGSVITDRSGFYRTPVFSKRVVDTVGAGDAFFSLTAPCITSGLPLDVVGFIGNATGALAITYLGNKNYIDKGMLLSFIKSLLG